MKDISSLRKEYTKHSLDITNVSKDPMMQFRTWFDEAVKSEVPEPNAMSLATVSAQGIPSCRIVLLKDIESNGFVFYTNYSSDKGKDIDHQPVVALTFFWVELERQVRIQGSVSRVSKETSTAYFQSRPIKSQLGAWVSPQSAPIASRELLEHRMEAVEKQFSGQDKLPKPEQWGGYLVSPFLFEFWQGRRSRLHDRIVYTQDKDQWKIQRLAP
jgi:pyridoxamine-phosphate oxidase